MEGKKRRASALTDPPRHGHVEDSVDWRERAAAARTASSREDASVTLLPHMCDFAGDVHGSRGGRLRRALRYRDTLIYHRLIGLEMLWQMGMIPGGDGAAVTLLSKAEERTLLVDHNQRPKAKANDGGSHSHCIDYGVIYLLCRWEVQRHVIVFEYLICRPPLLPLFRRHSKNTTCI